jgi:hypothetical protein
VAEERGITVPGVWSGESDDGEEEEREIGRERRKSYGIHERVVSSIYFEFGIEVCASIWLRSAWIVSRERLYNPSNEVDAIDWAATRKEICADSSSSK